MSEIVEAILIAGARHFMQAQPLENWTTVRARERFEVSCFSASRTDRSSARYRRSDTKNGKAIGTYG